MANATLAELRAVTYKPRDSWWTVLLVDPVAIHLVRLSARLRWVTPNRITLLAFALGFAAAGCFAMAGTPWLIAGALIYHVTFILDCVDGKLARWQGGGSVLGGWMDFTLDQVRLVICAIALLGGQYLATGRGVFLLMAVVVVFLNMFRYFNGFLMDRTLLDLRQQVSPTIGGPRRTASIGDDDPDPVPSEERLTPSSAVGQVRDWLTRRRIRMNVYSGIEFQMAVLIVAPLAAAILPGLSLAGPGPSGSVLGVTIAACVLMVMFELAQTTRFLLTAQSLRQAIPSQRATTPVPDQRSAYSTTGRSPAPPQAPPLEQ